MVREIDDLFSYVFIWHAEADACPKCRALNGREYRDQNLFDAELVDPEFGPIWDLDADHSLAHGAEAYNCRCTLEVQSYVDLGAWEPLTELRRKLAQQR